MNSMDLRCYHLVALMLTGFFIAGCGGSDGAPGAAGPAGPAGPPGPPGPPVDTGISIGDGGALTEEAFFDLYPNMRSWLAETFPPASTPNG